MLNHKKTKILTLIIAVLVMICTAAIPASVSAETSFTSYELSEPVMTIDVPSQTAVITSSVKKSDEMFRDGTFDYISAMTKMRDDSAILYGRNVKDDYYIELICRDNTSHVKNLSKLKEKKLQKLLSDYAKREDMVSSQIYNNDQLTFFYSTSTTNGDSGRFFYSEYYTVYKSMDITVRIISENDNLTDSELDILKACTDSLKLPQKRRFSISKVQGKSVFVTFVVISVSFVLLFFYRRHEERVNATVLPFLIKCREYCAARLASVKNSENSKKAEKSAVQNESETEVITNDTAESSAEIQDTDEEEEDLSSIDLDAAIAFFDDSIKGDAEL